MIRSYGYVAATVVACITVAGCSSGGGGTRASAPAPIVVTDGREAMLSAAFGERVSAQDQVTYESVEAPPDKVYQALIVAYSELGVPATVINPAQGLVAAIKRRAFARLGNVALSRYLSCGSSMTGPRADQDRIELSVISWARPDGVGKSRVETRFVANATDSGGTSTRMPCTSTGELESQLHKAAKQALGV
jgi:hypothetical protein